MEVIGACSKGLILSTNNVFAFRCVLRRGDQLRWRRRHYQPPKFKVFCCHGPQQKPLDVVVIQEKSLLDKRLLSIPNPKPKSKLMEKVIELLIVGSIAGSVLGILSIKCGKPPKNDATNLALVDSMSMCGCQYDDGQDDIPVGKLCHPETSLAVHILFHLMFILLIFNVQYSRDYSSKSKKSSRKKSRRRSTKQANRDPGEFIKGDMEAVAGSKALVVSNNAYPFQCISERNQLRPRQIDKTNSFESKPTRKPKPIYKLIKLALIGGCVGTFLGIFFIKYSCPIPNTRYNFLVPFSRSCCSEYNGDTSYHDLPAGYRWDEDTYVLVKVSMSIGSLAVICINDACLEYYRKRKKSTRENTEE